MPRDKRGAPVPFSVALRMLARRPYAVAELRRSLEKKFPDDPGVQDAVWRLRELGYLDDRKFAELHASSLARNRGFGPLRIRRELKARLVDYKYIDPALAQAFEEIDAQSLLDRALAKKIRALGPPVTPNKLRAICQSLLRRGFPAGDIMKAIRSRPGLRPVADQADFTDLEEGGENSKL